MRQMACVLARLNRLERMMYQLVNQDVNQEEVEAAIGRILSGIMKRDVNQEDVAELNKGIVSTGGEFYEPLDEAIERIITTLEGSGTTACQE